MKKTILITVILVLTVGLVAQGTPKKQKNYMLVFNTIEYSAQLKEAVTHFFKKVIQPGDNLIIVTPARFIGFSPKKLAVPKNQLIPGILDQVKNDISQGSVKYRTIMQEMQRSVQEMSGTASTFTSNARELLIPYAQHRQNLLIIRQDMEKKLLDYVNIFRRVKGENHLLMFFEKEFRPIPDKKTMGLLRDSPALSFKANEVYIQDTDKSGLDLQKLIAGFKYANVRFHFLYLIGKNIKSRRGVDYMENSGDVYSLFTKLAKATGGIKLTSSKTSVFIDQVDMVVEGKVTVEVVEETMEKEKKKN